jgi:hypothetical protein
MNPWKMSLTKEEDHDFLMQLLKDIPYFHQLYVKYHDPKWLELAKLVGANAADLQMKINTHAYP